MSRVLDLAGMDPAFKNMTTEESNGRRSRASGYVLPCSLKEHRYQKVGIDPIIISPRASLDDDTPAVRSTE
jgi:hypothetical protein